ncbi:ATP synthase subunit I [Pleurocapsales cyanobacterium LEGE 10410]|nr:ATP synthase subunit I [Pleurocapsales cyanobacterium LEGE 10410]
MSLGRSNWQQVFDIFALLLKDKKLRKLSRWALYFSIFALFCWMNWKLFLATSVGIGLMSSCYLLQNSHFSRYCQKWRSFFVGSNRQLVLAVVTGASGAFCTYLAAAVWANAENQWLATGGIIQGFASLSTLLLLLWSLRDNKAASIEAKLDRYSADLTHGDRLKRLVAIRQLTRLLVSNRLASEHYSQFIEYYRLMLSEPQPPVIKDALLESLAMLGAEKVFDQRSTVKIPLKLRHSRKPVLDKMV